MIGVKPAPKPEAPEAPEGGADGAEPTDEGGEDKKEDEKPRGNGTMWALFPGGYQVLSCVHSHRVRWLDSGPRGSRAHAPGSVALRSLAPLSPTVSLSFPRLLANSRRYARRQRRNLRSRATEEHTRACTLCEIRQYLKPSGEYDASMLPLHRTKLAQHFGGAIERTTHTGALPSPPPLSLPLFSLSLSLSRLLACSLCFIAVSARMSVPLRWLFFFFSTGKSFLTLQTRTPRKRKRKRRKRVARRKRSEGQLGAVQVWNACTRGRARSCRTIVFLHIHWCSRAA